MNFYAIELTTFRPGSATITYDQGHGVHPHGALAQLPDPIASNGLILASDLGYRTRESDPDGLRVYPPILSESFNVNRRMNLDPAQSSVAAGWGTIQLANHDGRFDAIAASWNSDGRDIRILSGKKQWDSARGIETDPPYSALASAFVGVATPWFLSDASLQIPVRDATYWTERPLQTTQYLGTGGLEGPTLANGGTLTGLPKPKARGGTTANPIRNVSPVLVDPVNRIYQYNDAPGQVVHLYEGGALTITFASDTANLYSGSAPAGQYRTDNSKGLFQLGSSPVAQITADVVGDFPVAGPKSIAADVARYVLTEDLAVPPGNMNLSSFSAAATAYPYVAGVYFGPNDSPDGASAASRIIGSFAASLVPTRIGPLSLMVLRSLPANPVAVARFDPSVLVSLVPQPLPPTLDPPPYRFRVAYAHNYTVQTSGFLGAATDAQKQFAAKPDSYAGWSSNAVLTAYRRPNDPPPIGGALLNQADAQAVANDLGAIWGVRRRLYLAELPVEIGLGHEFGDIVLLAYDMDDLRDGRYGQVVGELFRAGDATTKLLVLV